MLKDRPSFDLVKILHTTGVSGPTRVVGVGVGVERVVMPTKLNVFDIPPC